MKTIIATLLGTAVIAGSIVFIGMQYVSIKQAEYQSAAVDGCMNIAKFVYQDNNAGTNSLMVISDIYNECLTLKGSPQATQ